MIVWFETGLLSLSLVSNQNFGFKLWFYEAISLVLKLIWNRNLSVTLCFGLTFQTTVLKLWF